MSENLNNFEKFKATVTCDGHGRQKTGFYRAEVTVHCAQRKLGIPNTHDTGKHTFSSVHWLSGDQIISAYLFKYILEDYFVDSQSSVDNRDGNQGKGGLINNYIQHLDVQKSESFNCDICQKLFKSKILLEKHRSKHKRSESGKLPERKHATTPTKTCGVKQGDLPQTCNICNKTFRFHSNLERHKLIHTGEKPYLCNVCGKGFAQLSYLKIHSYIHSGEKPYKCQMCEKSFSAPGTLLTHVRTHTGERPHVCKICGRDFPQSGYLTTHLRTHTGERPVECKVCHKRFSQSGRLIIHMRIHSGEKPYPCNQCGKSFAVKGTLKKHLRTHTGEKPYVCSTCGQAFAQSGTLAIHTKVHKK